MPVGGNLMLHNYLMVGMGTLWGLVVVAGLRDQKRQGQDL